MPKPIPKIPCASFSGITEDEDRILYQHSLMKILVLGLLCVLPLQAAPETRLSQWVLDSWNMDSGLPQNTVTSIEQTRDGYLWLAMRAGVVQFDGVRSTLFDRSRIPGLGTNIITNLRVDGQGQLWAAPLEPGLLRWDGLKWNRVGTEAGLPQIEIAAMHVGPNGRLWAAPFKGGLFEWDGGRFNPVSTPKPLPQSSILRMLKGSDGSLWLGSAEHGIVRWNQNNWTLYDDRSGLTSNGVWAILEPKAGTILVGGRYGVDAFVDGKWDPKSRPPGLAGKVIESALALPGGELWWGTFREGLLKSTQNGVEQAQAPDVLLDNEIRSLFLDREGSIWIGTQAGLNRLSRPSVLFYGDLEGVGQGVLGKIAMAPDGGIYNHDKAGNIRVGPIGKQRILATHPAKDPDQDLLGVTRDGMAWVRDSRNLLYAIRSGSYRDAKFPDKQIAVSFLETVRGEIWVGTRTGSLFRQTSTGWDEVAPQMPALKAAVTLMAEDSSGSIYVGTRAGLARLRNGAWQVWKKQKGLPSELISALCLDSGGIAWIGTASGIVRLDGDNLMVIDKSLGLPDEAITALALDKRGNLWVASNAGIFQLPKRDLASLAERKTTKLAPSLLSAKDGLRYPEGWPFAGSWVGDDDSIWMLMMRGIVRIGPLEMASGAIVPETRVQGVLIDGKPAASLQNLVLPASASRVEFQFTALSLLRPERNRFRFRLEGFDKNWIDGGTQRSAVYTGLKGGNYRFEVIGSSGDGVESAQPAALAFQKTKAFVETPFFVILLLLAAAALFWLGMQLRVRSINARHQIALAERQRIARELHDGILQDFHGATLKLAALQLSNRDSIVGGQLDEVISGLEKSLQESRRAIQSLRGRQWDGVDLYPALVECAEGLCLPAKVKVVCKESFNVKDPKADIKDAFWQIARESIRNSLKHANPAQVQLDLSSRNRELVMQILDDGCGFHLEDAQMRTSSRFGLAGLEERAKSVGGKLSIESAPGKGCRVTFHVSL